MTRRSPQRMDYGPAYQIYNQGLEGSVNRAGDDDFRESSHIPEFSITKYQTNHQLNAANPRPRVRGQTVDAYLQSKSKPALQVIDPQPEKYNLRSSSHAGRADFSAQNAGEIAVKFESEFSELGSTQLKQQKRRKQRDRARSLSKEVREEAIVNAHVVPLLLDRVVADLMATLCASLEKPFLKKQQQLIQKRQSADFANCSTLVVFDDNFRKTGHQTAKKQKQNTGTEYLPSIYRQQSETKQIISKTELKTYNASKRQPWHHRPLTKNMSEKKQNIVIVGALKDSENFLRASQERTDEGDVMADQKQFFKDQMVRRRTDRNSVELASRKTNSNRKPPKSQQRKNLSPNGRFVDLGDNYGDFKGKPMVSPTAHFRKISQSSSKMNMPMTRVLVPTDMKKAKLKEQLVFNTDMDIVIPGENIKQNTKKANQRRQLENQQWANDYLHKIVNQFETNHSRTKSSLAQNSSTSLISGQQRTQEQNEYQCVFLNDLQATGKSKRQVQQKRQLSQIGQIKGYSSSSRLPEITIKHQQKDLSNTKLFRQVNNQLAMHRQVKSTLEMPTADKQSVINSLTYLPSQKESISPVASMYKTEFNQKQGQSIYQETQMMKKTDVNQKYFNQKKTSHPPGFTGSMWFGGSLLENMPNQQLRSQSKIPTIQIKSNEGQVRKSMNLAKISIQNQNQAKQRQELDKMRTRERVVNYNDASLSRISDTEKYASSIHLSIKAPKKQQQSDDDMSSAQCISSYFSAHKSTNIHNQALFGSEKDVGIKLKNVMQKSEMKPKQNKSNQLLNIPSKMIKRIGVQMPQPQRNRLRQANDMFFCTPEHSDRSNISPVQSISSRPKQSVQQLGDSQKVGPVEERLQKSSMKVQNQKVPSNIKSIWRKKNRKTYRKQVTLPTQSVASIIIDEDDSVISSDDDFDQAVNQAQQAQTAVKAPPSVSNNESPTRY